jgi:uncharacterized protein
MSPGRSQSTSEKTPADLVDAMVLATRGSEIRRDLRVGDLDRLRDLIADSDAAATLIARFHLVDGKAAVAGRVTATLQLACQRCLQPTSVPIDDEFHVVVASSEVEMSELPESQDAVIADATRLDLAWLIEEQLLLARPLAPMHESEAECRRKPQKIAARRVSAEEQETQRPFAGLRDLMNRRE